MAYTITSMQARPDVGFRSMSRHTAEGARDLAEALRKEGALEIEVRDSRGDLRSWQDIARLAADSGARERDVLARLSPG